MVPDLGQALDGGSHAYCSEEKESRDRSRKITTHTHTLSHTHTPLLGLLRLLDDYPSFPLCVPLSLSTLAPGATYTSQPMTGFIPASRAAL